MFLFIFLIIRHRKYLRCLRFRLTGKLSVYLVGTVALFLLTACAGLPRGQENIQAPAIPIALVEGVESVSNKDAPPEATFTDAPADKQWWLAFNDTAINRLIDFAMLANPTLEQALAHVEAAKAQLQSSRAATMPTVSVSASTGRGQAQTGSGSNTETGRSSDIGVSALWELDLFGRLRAGRMVASSHLDARNADATAMRISLSVQIAAAVINWRSCTLDLRTKQTLAASLSRAHGLSEQRVSAGFDAATELDRVRASLLTAASDVTSQTVACERHVHALSTLSGLSVAAVRQLLQVPPAVGIPLGGDYRVIELSEDSAEWTTQLKQQGVPLPPVGDTVPVVRAEVVAQQSNVIAALDEADAAWFDIEQSRADRWPKIDLSASMMRQWLGAGTSSLNYTTWLLGPVVSAMVYDGGAAQASISAAEARYRESVAKVHVAVRSSIEDILNALTQIQAADTAFGLAAQSLSVNSRLLNISESKWAAKSENISQREAGWRQFVLSQNVFMLAAGECVQARIALVRATESHFVNQSNNPLESSRAAPSSYVY